jgi:imidazolonepropionase-like amidohydrolase
VRRLLAAGSLACLLTLGGSHIAAQDLAITNARVIVGNGTVINSGTLIVRGGKIASVSAGPADTQD